MDRFDFLEVRWQRLLAQGQVQPELKKYVEQLSAETGVAKIKVYRAALELNWFTIS